MRDTLSRASNAFNLEYEGGVYGLYVFGPYNRISFVQSTQSIQM